MDILAVKRGDTLVPYRDEDREALSKYKDGDVLKVRIFKMLARSLKQLNLYWGGLIKLALDYWQPTAGMITPSEIAIVKSFARDMEKATNLERGALDDFAADFIERVKKRRIDKIEAPAKNKEALHDWVKEQLGYWIIEITPTGYFKRLKSISVDKMSQEEFDKFYREAFDLIWNFVMVQVFESKEQVQDAVVARLLEMG
jgi:hypothetical protein